MPSLEKSGPNAAELLREDSGSLADGVDGAHVVRLVSQPLQAIQIISRGLPSHEAG